MTMISTTDAVNDGGMNEPSWETSRTCTDGMSERGRVRQSSEELVRRPGGNRGEPVES